MWWRAATSAPSGRSSHALTLISCLGGLLSCEPPLPRDRATVTLSLELTPSLTHEGPLALWEAPPSAPLPLSVELESSARAGAWSRRGVAQPVAGESASAERSLYQAEGLFRSLTALELPAEELSIDGLSGGWLHPSLSEADARQGRLGAPSALLSPLSGLDYRSTALPISSPRRASHSITPWSMLPWLSSSEWRPSDPIVVALEPLTSSLNHSSGAWETLAERLSLKGAWSLLGLIFTLQSVGERDALKAVVKELAISALAGPEALSEGDVRGLRALPCVLEWLGDSDELSRVLSEAQRGSFDARCALPLELVWVKVSPPPSHVPTAGGLRLELKANSFDARPLSLRVERLSAQAPRSPKTTLSQEELRELTPYRVALVERCEGQGAALSCALDWRDAEGDALTLLVTVTSEDGRVTLGGRVIRYTLAAPPAWRLSLGLLSRPRLVDEQLNTWRPPQLMWSRALDPQRPYEELEGAEGLSLSGAGLAQLPLLGYPSPLSVWLELMTSEDTEALQLWSPFPAPGRWRSPLPSEQLNLSIDADQLLSEDTLAAAPPLPDLTLLLSPLSARGDERLREAALTALGGSISPLTSPDLPERLEALAQAPERLVELIGDPAQAEASGWSQVEVAHLRAWLCLETSTQGLYSEPSPRLSDSGALSAEWLEWMSAGCVIGALSWALPERGELFEALSAPGSLEALATQQLWGSNHLQGAWLERLLGRSLDSPDARPVLVSLLSAPLEAGGELVAHLTQASATLSTPLEGRAYLLSIESVTGLRSLSLQYLEAPWLTEGSPEGAPSPYLSARLLSKATLDALVPERPERACLWRRAPLSALQGAWRLDPVWRELHPLSDPRWLLSYERSPDERYDDPCHVGVQLDASSLPEGEYVIELSYELTWGGSEARTLRFTIDRSPLTAQVRPLAPLTLLDQAQLDAQDHLLTHAHLSLTDPSVALSQGERQPLALIQLNRPARCELNIAPSLSALPPRLPALFDEPERSFRSITLSPITPDEQVNGGALEPSLRWELSGAPREEGSQRVSVRCVDDRAGHASLTLDLTLDVSPPALKALWLTQVDEALLNARRLTEAGDTPPPVGWLLYTAGELTSLDALLPEERYDLRGEERDPALYVIERWRGWWGPPQCSDEPPAGCLLEDEGPCLDEVAARCRARAYPLTLHALLEDEQWEPEALSLSLTATRADSSDLSSAHINHPQAPTPLDTLSYLQRPLNSPWERGEWAPPSEDGDTTLTLRATALSPAHRAGGPPVFTPSVRLRSLTPPPLLTFERTWRPAPQLDELSALTQTSLIHAQVSNPHPDPLWLQVSEALTSLSAEGSLDRASDARAVSPELAQSVAESCLWDQARSSPAEDEIIHSATPPLDLLSAGPCATLPIPQTQHFSWRAELEWSIEAPMPVESEGWLLLSPGERADLTLNAHWALPPLLYGTLLGLGQLPPPRAQHYVLPHTFSGVFWGEVPCEGCAPELVFGRPYRRLRALSLTLEEPSSADGVAWTLQVRSELNLGSEEGVIQLPLGEFPAELRYELIEP